MFSSPFEPSDQHSQQPADAEPETTSPEKGVDYEALEKVLKQTMSSISADERIEQEDLEPFLQVGRRYKGRELTLEPVVVELVQAILESKIATPHSVPSDFWRDASRTVGKTLWEDSASREKLAALWSRLSGEV